MRFNAPSGITPLQARLATKYYAYLFIPAFIILVFFVIYLLYQIRKRIRSSPEWLEAQKKRPTTYGDKASNISYLIYNTAEVNNLFNAQYAAMVQNGSSEKKITSLFRLRRKIEIQDAADTWITSTAGIPEETKLSFLLSPGVQIKCTLKKNTAENMTLSIPRTLYNSERKPAPLSKSDFVFMTRSGMTYRFNIPCVFSAVNDKHEKTKPHNGILANVSGDGCAVVTNLPIKENQRLRVSIMLSETVYEATGLIVGVHKNRTFSLGILFTDISDEARNRIFAYVYRYGIGQDDERNISS